MRLFCAIGWHRASPYDRWNRGYYFSKCRACGCDLVRTATGRWHVPNGYRIVWEQKPARDTDWVQSVGKQLMSELSNQKREGDEQAPIAPALAGARSEVPMEQILPHTVTGADEVQQPVAGEHVASTLPIDQPLAGSHVSDKVVAEHDLPSAKTVAAHADAHAVIDAARNAGEERSSERVSQNMDVHAEVAVPPASRRVDADNFMGEAQELGTPAPEPRASSPQAALPAAGTDVSDPFDDFMRDYDDSGGWGAPLAPSMIPRGFDTDDFMADRDDMVLDRPQGNDQARHDDSDGRGDAIPDRHVEQNDGEDALEASETSQKAKKVRRSRKKAGES